MLAEKNEFLNEASETIYQLSAEDKIREQCWAREEYDRIERTVKRQFEIAAAEKAKLKEQLKAQQVENKANKALIAQLRAQLAQTDKS